MPELFDKLTFKHIYFRAETFTSDTVQPAVDELAAYLEANRVSDSPFVFLFAHNHIKMVIAYFAIIKANLIVVPLHPEIKPLELDDLLHDSDPVALISIDRASLAFDYGKEIEFRKSSQPFDTDDDLSDVCTMIYTAAEDGYYKGAMLTRDNLVTMATSIAHGHSLDGASLSCAILPYQHIYGLQVGVLAPAVAGASLLIPDLAALTDLSRLSQAVLRSGATDVYALPAVFYLMAKLAGIRDGIRSVKTFTSGGYKLPRRVFDSFLAASGREILEGYGLTEASPICTYHLPGRPVKPESVGPVFTCCELRIMNDDGIELPIGHAGEVCVKGPNVMKGYYRHPEATARVLCDGWLRTGDLGKMDEDGYVYLTGLKKRMLNVGGLNVYPAELERLVKLNDNVRDVEVHGEESALGGHTVCARVTLRKADSSGRKTLSDWCADHMSRFKIPKRFEFV